MPNSVLRTDGAFRGNGCLGTVAFLREGKKGQERTGRTQVGTLCRDKYREKWVSVG